MNIRQLLDKHISQALIDAGAPEGSLAIVKPSARPEHGDYQANGIMGAAKKLKVNPRVLATAVLDHLDLSDYTDLIEIAGPGFLNIHLKDEWLCRQLQATSQSETLGVEPVKSPLTIVVDYSGPNLAKEMHVGHLRSTIIGDSVARTLSFQGHKVIRQNHVGDWGTQFGMLIAYMVERQDQTESLSTCLADLENFYRQAKQRFDESSEFAETAREYVVKLQSGDLDCLQLWQQFIDVSIQHCEAIYQQLNVQLTCEDIRPESAYNEDLPVTLRGLSEAGLLTEDQGAQCVFLDEFKGKDDQVLPLIVQKSDGGYLYATSDLAAIRYRNQALQADRVLYFVDARQNLHFQQVFAVACQAGFVREGCSLEHMPFGTMLGNDSKPFKTRTGGTVKLVDLLQEAEERAFALVTEKNPDMNKAERQSIAHIVGIGAVKYADLAKNRTSDYIFTWEQMLSLVGNTAPYLQYAYARIRTLSTKAGAIDLNATIRLDEVLERQLAIKLLQFPEAVEVVGKEGMPNLLCSYLHELAGQFMSFYEGCPILKAEDAVKNSRLKLADLTAQTLKTGLGLLGIETLERM